MTVNTSTLLSNNKCTLKLRVRYQECDAQGIVFNARYGDYADIADTEYFRQLVGNDNELIALGFDKRVISYQIQWANPAFFDDVLHLCCETIHVGNTSYTVLIKCAREDNGNLQPVAEMKITYVMIETKGNTKTAIPERLKEGFNKAFDVTVDQTGR